MILWNEDDDYFAEQRYEADLKATWSNDPIVLSDGKGTPELQGKNRSDQLNTEQQAGPSMLPSSEKLDFRLPIAGDSGDYWLRVLLGRSLRFLF